MNKDLLLQVILDQRQYAANRGIPREIDARLLSCKEVLVITGVRRCGKSVLLRQIQDDREDKDYYLNFDDERLINFKVDDFQMLCEVFTEQFGVQNSYYLDEIQNIQGWERFVGRLYNQGCKVFVTGSNANLLSRELGTHLTGRHVNKELYPFSFKEYLAFKHVEWDKASFHTTVGKAGLLKHVKEYLRLGGLPQYVDNRNDDYLQSLYNDIIYKDVLVRNNLSGERSLREMVYYMASNAAQRFTYKSLANAVGLKSPDTAKSYVDCLEETYLIGQLRRFDSSVKVQARSPKKIYFIDNAIVNKIGFNATDNHGRLLENAVYVELARRGYDLYYHSNGAECDFVVRDGGHVTQVMQVSISLNDEGTRRREVAGLLSAMKAYDLSEGTVVTLDEREDMEVDGRHVRVLPVWQWMLM